MRVSPLQVFGGYFLFTLHSRCRFSDAMHLKQEPFIDEAHDLAFVEATSMHTKTSRMKSGRGIEVPLVGFALGVSGTKWARAWLAARAQFQLGVNPAMPAINKHNMFVHGEPMSTTSGTAWLTCLLQLADVYNDRQTLGTHSAKATILSWCAKRGLDASDRRLLGQHRKAKDISVLTYSRDQLAKPLRALHGLLLEIQTGTFKPDETRSGYLKDPVAAPVSQSASAEDGVVDASDTSESSSTEDAKAEQEMVVKTVNMDLIGSAVSMGVKLLVNTASEKIHRSKCGRAACGVATELEPVEYEDAALHERAGSFCLRCFAEYSRYSVVDA
eukprot:966825-Amphidinium_carterae.3